MKVVIFSVAILILQLNSVSGQSKIVLDAPNHIDTTIRPLVLVNTFKTDFNHLVLDPKEIESIEVLKDSTAKLKYGDAGKFGVIIIYPKPRVKFLRVDKILKIYNLSNEDKKLRICINKTLLRNPQLILIEKSQIESVEVTTDRHGINIHDANSGEKFINIITRIKNNNGL